MKLDPNSTYFSTEARDLWQTQQIQLAALVCSGVSVTSSIVTFYWFLRMQKLFRHRLIMLLLYGDVMRSAWYFIFAAHSIARGAVTTESRFCQSSGFLVQYGTETSDYAVLVIAVHSALQIFRPAARGMSDGLYEHRTYVFAAGFILPVLMSALAFINPDDAYESLGAFCQLPIRPFWYRLALSWIPRYLIAFTILSLAGAIYAYVGCEFRSYANLSQSLQTPMTTTFGLSRVDGDLEAGGRGHAETVSCTSDQSRRASSIAHDIVASQRKDSTVVFGQTTYAPSKPIQKSFDCTQPLARSLTDLLPIRSLPVRPSLFVIPSGYTVEPSLSALDIQGPLSPLTQPTDDPIASTAHQKPPESTEPKANEPQTSEDQPARRPQSSTSPTERHMRRQRRRIHRQLRLLFIYPLVYVLMWLVPFVQHIMNYSDFYANHPPWFTRLGQAVCLASMGFVDCLIFSIREKPWRSIITSDGTVWGSLAMSRSPRASTASWIYNDSRSRGSRVSGAGLNTEQSVMGDSVHESRVARVRNSVRTSASDDYAKLAAEQARKRLDLEKIERLAAMQERIMARSRVEEGREVVRVTTINETVVKGEKWKGKGKGKGRALDRER
ncbi:G protein-coupled glucose receptor regulating Gpa2-domain-containing protein [Phaeosphaeria sp. MPI-PUGE-AT-0046c]|nr:G protein-coupled glucose receptor regulating Gpa2-domain-containing protein [Phaeosphaeria sp. MPI-PUGE-AT-0046c]